MAKKFILLWVVGLVTWVPYGTYYLLFHAAREEYAFYIVGVLFWIFGYWGVVGPLISAWKIRSVFKAIESCRNGSDLRKVLGSCETEEAAIDLIASENKVPRFIAKRVYGLFAARLRGAGPNAEKKAVP